MIKALALTAVVGSVVLVTVAFKAVAQDEPDLQREKRLHQIYKRFNTQPTSPDKWDQAVSGASAQTYKVQAGDTLWDISETFFADPDFWPKIWSLNNDQIVNPHEIKPNESVQFIAGTMGEAPSIAVNADGSLADAGEPAPEGNSEAPPEEDHMPPGVLDFWGENSKPMTPKLVDVDLADLDLPPPIAKNKSKRAANLPASLPGWAIKTEKRREVKVELEPLRRSPGSTEVTVLTYVQEGELPTQGKIVEAEAGADMAHEGMYVTVKMANPQTGQKWLVVRQAGKIADSQKENTGLLIQIDGEIQVQDAVNAEEGLYRALVLKSYNPIIKDAQLVSGEVQRTTYDRAEAGGEAKSRIVGGADGDNRHMFGPGEILFLDGGTRAGLSAGQSLNVFRVEKVRDPDTAQKINPRAIAQVRIVRTGDNFATAVVTSGPEEVRVGDSTTRNLQVE